MADFSYEIKMELGVMSENKKGWTKEFNLVSWSGRSPKYDIRDWAPEHTQMGKGITLTEEELRQLGELISREIRRLDSEDSVNAASEAEVPKKEKTQAASAPKSPKKEKPEKTQKTSTSKSTASNYTAPDKPDPRVSESQKPEPDISGAVNFDDM